MSAVHTPGPWAIEWAAIQGGDGHCIVDSSDMQELSRIASVFFHDDHDGETAANARLIAAAPDLLIALQGLLSAVQRSICDGSGPAQAVAAKAICLAVKGVRE